MAKLNPSLLDSSLWIDFTRPRSPRALKQFIAPYILAPNAVLAGADPVRGAALRDGERNRAH